MQCNWYEVFVATWTWGINGTIPCIDVPKSRCRGRVYAEAHREHEVYMIGLDPLHLTVLFSVAHTPTLNYACTHQLSPSCGNLPFIYSSFPSFRIKQIFITRNIY